MARSLLFDPGMTLASTTIPPLAAILMLYACSSGSPASGPATSDVDSGVVESDPDSGTAASDSGGAAIDSGKVPPAADGGTPVPDAGALVPQTGADAVIEVPALSQVGKANYILATDKTAPILHGNNAGSFTHACPATLGTSSVPYAVIEVRNTKSSVALLDLSAHVSNGFGDGSAQIAVYTSVPTAATVASCTGLYNEYCHTISACLLSSNNEAVKIGANQSLFIMVQAPISTYTKAASIEVKTTSLF